MAVMSAFSARVALPPRHTPTAPAWRVPPRVYSPLSPRRLAHPMAVPVSGTPNTGRGSPLSFLHKR